MISPRLLAITRCPECGGSLAPAESGWRCTGCGTASGRMSDGFLDLRPRASFDEQTKYVDEALHADARQSRVAPPVLSAGLRYDVLREFLRPGPGDALVDLGCGSGRMLVWNQGFGGYAVGIDVSPFFAREAVEGIDLVLGDLRRLPFEDGAFTKAYALDVLEHLSRDALAAMLGEAWRVLAPGGKLFVYSHVRRNARLAVAVRAINRVAAALDRIGLVDLRHERLRKSDHVNPLADIPDLESVVERAGFRIQRILYYTPVVGGFVENILVRIAERLATRTAERRAEPADAPRRARAAAQRIVAGRGLVYRGLRALTWIMKLDLWLFGSIRSGPFFALLVKQAPAGR